MHPGGGRKAELLIVESGCTFSYHSVLSMWGKNKVRVVDQRAADTASVLNLEKWSNRIGGWTDLHTKEIYSLFVTPDLRTIISRTVRWEEHVGCMGQRERERECTQSFVQAAWKEETHLVGLGRFETVRVWTGFVCLAVSWPGASEEATCCL